MSESPTRPSMLEVERLAWDVLQSYRENPVELLGPGSGEEEYRYLFSRFPVYVNTLRDVIGHFGEGDPHDTSLLEVGSYLGLLSVVLARMGFRVTAVDVEAVMQNRALQALLADHGIASLACSAAALRVPVNDECFDGVILCDVLEHLNTNPLPVIAEINRVTRKGGFLYLTTPNLAARGHRVALVEGQSIRNPIRHFEAQLRGELWAQIGIHWREYTAQELQELLAPRGYAEVVVEYAPRLRDDRAGCGRRLLRMVKALVRAILLWRPMKRVVFSCLFDMDLDLTMRPGLIAIATKASPCSVSMSRGASDDHHPEGSSSDDVTFASASGSFE